MLEWHVRTCRCRRQLPPSGAGGGTCVWLWLTATFSRRNPPMWRTHYSLLCCLCLCGWSCHTCHCQRSAVIPRGFSLSLPLSGKWKPLPCEMESLLPVLGSLKEMLVLQSFLISTKACESYIQMAAPQMLCVSSGSSFLVNQTAELWLLLPQANYHKL